VLYDANEAIGVERTVMLLRQPQRSPFPVGHLLHFANLFPINSQSDFGQAGLLFDEVNFPEIRLCIDKVFDVFDPLHVGQLLGKLVNVRAEAETNDR